MMHPAIKRLVLVWLVLAAVTLAGIPIGHAMQPRPLGAALTVVLLGLAWAKAAVLLNDYLDLRQAPGWNSGLRLGLALLLAVIGGLSLMARLA